MKLTRLFKDFFESEKASGLVLLFCTALSLILANSLFGKSYLSCLGFGIITPVGTITLSAFVNDGLMTVFFLLVGLEIERELYIGELSQPKNALLPIVAAAGGSIIPPVIHFCFNHGLPSQGGAGIPMATDIAFAIGILSLAGRSVPVSLKVFLTALAIIDDLFAVVVISIFYSSSISLIYLGASVLVFGILIACNRLGFNRIVLYLIGGSALWYTLHHSGIHATVAGVFLAIALPFRDGKETSPSYRVQHFLHRPVAFIIMPLFALVNTGVRIDASLLMGVFSNNGLGIIIGLFAGKVIGITGFSYIFSLLKAVTIPSDWTVRHILGAGFLGGIGFTMSIFIALLGFQGSPEFIESSKISILVGSLLSGLTGYMLLRPVRR